MAGSHSALPNRKPNDNFFVDGHGFHQVIFKFLRPRGDHVRFKRTEGWVAGPNNFEVRLDEWPGGWTISAKLVAGLIGLDSMWLAERIAVDMIGKYGFVSEESPAVGRADFTTDVSFEDPRGAHRALQALSVLSASRHQRICYSTVGASGIETVAWSTKSKGIRLRVYDKSWESDLPGPETVIRFEHQYRPRGRELQTLEMFAASDLSQYPIKPLAVGGSKQMVAGDLEGVYWHLKRRRDSGAVTQTVAEKIIGALVWERQSGAQDLLNSRAAKTRRELLAQHGVVYQPELDVPFDLGPLLTAVRAAWTG